MSESIIYRVTINSERKKAKENFDSCDAAFLAQKDKTTRYAEELNAMAKLYQQVYHIYLQAPDFIEL